MNHRVRRRLALGALVPFAVLAAVTTTAGAQTAPGITELGWWSRSPAATAAEGGFRVAAAPDGPTSVAALRIETGAEGLSAAPIEVPEVGGVGVEVAAIRACPTTENWTAASPGPLEEAPPQDQCQGTFVDLTRDAAAKTWKGDLGPLLAGKTGVASVVIVPGPAATPGGGQQPPPPAGPLPAPTPAGPSPVPLAFDVELGPPVLTAAPGGAPSASGDSGGSGFTDEPAAVGGDAGTSSPSFGAGSSSFSTDALDLPAPAASIAAPPPPGQPVPQQLATTGINPVRDFDPLDTGGGRDWGKAAFLTLLAAAVGTVAALGRRAMESGALSRVPLLASTRGGPPAP